MATVRRFQIGDWVTAKGAAAHRILAYEGESAYRLDFCDDPVEDALLSPTKTINNAVCYPEDRAAEQLRADATIILRQWLDGRVGIYEQIDETAIGWSERSNDHFYMPQFPDVFAWHTVVLTYTFPAPAPARE